MAQFRTGGGVRGVCLVSGLWCLVSGVWRLVSGVWCVTHPNPQKENVLFKHTVLFGGMQSSNSPWVGGGLGDPLRKTKPRKHIIRDQNQKMLS